MEQENKVEVMIGGMRFTLVGSKSPDYSKRVAAYVDDEISALRKNNRKLNLTMCTTLAAVNIAGEVFELKEKLLQIENESKEAMANYKPALKRVEELEEQNAKLSEDIDRLKDDLVGSLNTIGDMNKGFSGVQEENVKMKDEIVERDDKISEITANLKSLQQELIRTERDLRAFESREQGKKG